MSTHVSPTLRPVPHPAKPRTDTEAKLWQALLDNPGSTAVALSVAAGIGKSTAPKILTRWHRAGIVSRTAGIADGGSRPADRWSITNDNRPCDDDHPAEDVPAADRVARDHDALADGQAASAGEDGRWKGERLAPGALRGMVEDYLRDNPGQDFTPNAVSRALSRSAGAVHNALEKLVTSGYAARTSDKPKKYTLACAVDDSTAQR